MRAGEVAPHTSQLSTVCLAFRFSQNGVAYGLLTMRGWLADDDVVLGELRFASKRRCDSVTIILFAIKILRNLMNLCIRRKISAHSIVRLAQTIPQIIANQFYCACIAKRTINNGDEQNEKGCQHDWRHKQPEEADKKKKKRRGKRKRGIPNIRLCIQDPTN